MSYVGYIDSQRQLGVIITIAHKRYACMRVYMRATWLPAGHRRSRKKTALRWHEDADCPPNIQLLRGQELCSSCRKSLEQFAVTLTESRFVMLPVQAVAEDIFIGQPDHDALWTLLTAPFKNILAYLLKKLINVLYLNFVSVINLFYLLTHYSWLLCWKATDVSRKLVTLNSLQVRKNVKVNSSPKIPCDKCTVHWFPWFFINVLLYNFVVNIVLSFTLLTL